MNDFLKNMRTSPKEKANQCLSTRNVSVMGGTKPLGLDEAGGDGFLYVVSCPSSEGREPHVLRQRREKEGRDYDTAKANLSSGNTVL